MVSPLSSNLSFMKLSSIGKGILESPLIYTFFFMLILAKLRVIIYYGINFDEFAFLSIIFDLEHGEVKKAFTQGSIYIFHWMTFLPYNEITLIQIGRFCALVCHLLTGYFIYKSARFFYKDESAIFAPILWFSFSYVLWQGTSFRVDPFINVLLSCALFLSLNPAKNLKSSLIIGILIAISGFLSVKSIFMAIVIGGILILQFFDTHRKKQTLVQVFSIFSTSVLTFTILTAIHMHYNGLETGSLGGPTKNFAQVNDFIFDVEFFRGYIYLAHSIMYNPVYWLALFYSLLALALQKTTKENPIRAFSLLLLLLPLTTVLFYKNAYPYFYAFMLIPTTIVCINILDIIFDYLSPQKKKTFKQVIIILCCLQVYIHNIYKVGIHNNTSQTQIVENVHNIFPDKVPYLTDLGMISTYDNVGFFGKFILGRKYYNNGLYGTMESTIKNKKPVFILDHAEPPADAKNLEDVDFLPYLNEADKTFIKENYIPHWRGIYVSGKNIELPNEGTHKTFNIYIPGLYTIESKTPVTINEKNYMPNQTLMLKTGTHTISSANPAPPSSVTLRWGDHLHKPSNNDFEWLLYQSY